MTNPFKSASVVVLALTTLLCLSGASNRSIMAAPKARVGNTVPPREQIKQMTRNTLLVWNKAVQARNFKPLYAVAATMLKKTTTPREMRRSFQKFIDRKIDIGSIRNLEPTFDPGPFLTKEKGRKGFLEVNGSYETEPGATQFQLTYANEKGVWKIAGICVYVDSGSHIAIDEMDDPAPRQTKKVAGQ